MPHFTETPEAIDFIVSQAWLSPDEPVARAISFVPGRAASNRIGPAQALREIVGILKRTSFARRQLN